MSSSETQRSHIPGVLGGDLPEAERLAFEEGHDADIPSNKGVEKPHEQQHQAVQGPPVESEKKDDRRSSSSSSSNGDAAQEKDVEKGGAEATAEEAEEPRDPNLVDWDGPEDPANPYNWPAKKKWANIAILSLLTLLVPLASSMFAPGVPDVMRDFGTTKYDFTVSISRYKALVDIPPANL